MLWWKESRKPGRHVAAHGVEWYNDSSIHIRRVSVSVDVSKHSLKPTGVGRHCRRDGSNATLKKRSGKARLCRLSRAKPSVRPQKAGQASIRPFIDCALHVSPAAELSLR